MQWEFARVTRSYKEVWVTYIRPNGGVKSTRAWRETEKNDPVFEGILGYLGGREWELVSVIYSQSEFGINYEIVTAYFKRPVVDGRSTEEPPIPSNLWI